MFAALLAVVLIGWVAAAALGTQAYFLGEQSKPIHARNWNSEGFDQAARSVTGRDAGDRTPGFDVTDAYSSQAFS